MQQTDKSSFDESKSTYVEREIRRQFNGNLQRHIITLLVIVAVVAVIEFEIAAPELRYFILSVRVATILAILVAVPVLQAQPDKLRFALFWIEQAMALGYAAGVFRKYYLGLEVGGSLGEFSVLAHFIFLICVSPITSSTALIGMAMAYMSLMISVLAISGVQMSVYSIIVFFVLIMAVVVRMHLVSILRLRHGMDFDLRQRMLPKGFMDQTIDLGRLELSTVLAMKSTGVLCIATDWRGFRRLFERHESKKILEGLSDYYDQCVRILDETFGTGRYSIDWMADELLVYVPFNTQNLDSVQATANTALGFCKRLQLMCLQFSEEKGLPEGIEIGVALGRASFGLSGTSNSRRMFAFGYPVSLARAIQHHAKRVHLNNGVTFAGSIAMSPAVYNALGSDLKTKRIESDEFLKRMDCDAILVLEP
jgi:class 3 adenylate cyclase